MSEPWPIYVVFGTRAQLIKMAPVMRQLSRRGISYSLIYTGQHRESISELLEEFDLPGPDVNMVGWREEAETKGGFARWLIRAGWTILTGARSVIPRPGVLLTHGDTASTVLGALLGRLSGCTVMHVEAGLRSFNIWNPFPEELCRLLTFYLSDHYLCPDGAAAANLSNYSGRKVVLGSNTLYDSVRFALEQEREPSGFSPPYVVASIHRYENVFDRHRFEDVIMRKLRDIARRIPVVFVLHPVTRRALMSYGLWEGMKAARGLRLCDRMGYVDFINLIRKADFVITDGGSNQEELSYLGVPCLLFREATERREGLGQNVVLSEFDEAEMDDFLENYESFAVRGARPTVSPSRRAVDAIAAVAGHASRVQ